MIVLGFMLLILACVAMAVWAEEIFFWVCKIFGFNYEYNKDHPVCGDRVKIRLAYNLYIYVNCKVYGVNKSKRTFVTDYGNKVLEFKHFKWVPSTQSWTDNTREVVSAEQKAAILSKKGWRKC